MKTLIFDGNEFEAKKIVKTKNGIIGYSNDRVIFEFKGISDFSKFEIKNGAPFDEPESTLEEQVNLLGLQLATEKILNMQKEQEKDDIINSLGYQLTSMKLEILKMKGGV